MATAVDLLNQNTRGRTGRNGYHAYHPTRTLADNLRIFEALVWRDYMRRDCLALADQIRAGKNSWDANDVSMAVWRHMTAYPYLAPPSGEELYLDFAGFMQRRGGDCDNKTLVQCCLLLASGVRCRAVVIELPRADGKPSGEGHMFCECYIPGQGWVAFDAAKDHPTPGSRGHETPGYRRSVVDFSGTRPQEAAIMSRLNTAGYVMPGMFQANVITGMLTGRSMRTSGPYDDCGPVPSASDPNFAALQADREECVAKVNATDPPPGFWESWITGIGKRGADIAGEGLLGGFNRKMYEWGLGPEPTGGASDVIVPLAIIAGVGTLAYFIINRG